jgi:hypothetical protein
MSRAPLNVFISYSRLDESFKDELVKHLKTLQDEAVIQIWDDRGILPGTNWDQEIQAQLSAADIVLLLISSDFLASEYCWGKEVQKSLKRHEKGKARVIPVVLRPVDWLTSPLGKLQALPENAKPITNWDNRDEAFLSVAQGIRKATLTMRSRGQRWKLVAASVLGVPLMGGAIALFFNVRH